MPRAKRFWILKLLLPALAFLASGFYVYHYNNALSAPGLFRPDANGFRPGPGRPMAPVVVMVDEKLGKWPHLGAILQSLEAWSHVEGATASFIYGGTLALEGGFAKRLGTSDGMNTIELVTSGWFDGANTAAAATWEFDPDTGRLLEADIFLNGQDYSWGIYGQMDVGLDTQTYVTHELGHVLGLGHSQERLATMSGPPVLPDQSWRQTLHLDDQEAARWLYPARESDIPLPSLWRLAAGGCDIVWNYYYLTAGASVVDESSSTAAFCLYAEGLRGTDFTFTFISETTGLLTSTAASVIWSSTNQISLDLDLSLLPADSYGLELVDEYGHSGKLRQALVVKNGTSPTAVLTPGYATIKQGQTLVLDGSGSGPAVTGYHWFLQNDAAFMDLEGETGSSLNFSPSKPGPYRVGLMVEDGATNYSLAAYSLVNVEPNPEDDEQGFGCRIVPAAPASAISQLALPVFFCVFIWLSRSAALKSGRPGYFFKR